MKSIEQRKIAIIKSNAAPEVKLKALEKLDEKHNAGSQADYQRADKVLQQAIKLCGDARDLVPVFSSELMKLEREIIEVRREMGRYARG